MPLDTLLLAGSSMSGCVRATAVDAFDRSEELVERNLFDMDAKYADAVSHEEPLAYLAAHEHLVSA